MNVLFLTTYNVDIYNEHFFTKNVWKELSKSNSTMLASILFSEDIDQSKILEDINNESLYFKLYIPIKQKNNREYIIKSIIGLYKQAVPDIIHSNMIEGYDIEAAKSLNIPIVITIHIGGFICPRSGGNGFLMYNDSICNKKVSDICMKCGCMDLPLPYLSYCILKILPKSLIRFIALKIQGKNIFYLTPLIGKYIQISERSKYIGLLKYAHIVAANQKLVNLLELNGVLKDNIELLPHGVKGRMALPFPAYHGKIIFYYLGRIQYSKGLHILIKAFDRIDKDKYELHIIGDAEKSRHEIKYEKLIRKISMGKNIIFHGRLPNDQIESVIKNCHVMIHPTICLEVYGISISESLSLGRPVLSTKCGGSEMQVIDGYNGWLISPNSIDEMTAKIKDIINNFQEVYNYHLNAKNPNRIEDYNLKLMNLYKKISVNGKE